MSGPLTFYNSGFGDHIAISSYRSYLDLIGHPVFELAVIEYPKFDAEI